MKYYNRTNTCGRCGNNLELCPGTPYREYNNAGNWTGNWLCKKCCDNRYFRKGNLSPTSTTGKGYIFEQVTCKVRGIKNLNIVNDNFHSEMDHSIDPEYGIIDTKGAFYNHIAKIWSYNWSFIHTKEFDNIFFYCANEKGIERVYIFPWEEVINRMSITIYKNPKDKWGRPKFSWYDKYRVDEKPYNDEYQEILKEIENGRDPVLRRENVHPSI